MNLQRVKTAFSLLFAPLFMLCLHFFGFEMSLRIFLFLSLVYLGVSLKETRELKTLAPAFIYVLFMVLAFIFGSFESVKLIPVFLSSLFLLFFIDAFLHKRQIILHFVEKFYKKEIPQEERDAIAKSDGYWVFVTFINVLIQLFFVFYESSTLWAIYSSFGWYTLFAFALLMQVVFIKSSLKMVGKV